MMVYVCINCPRNRKCTLTIDDDMLPPPAFKCPLGEIDHHNNDEDRSQWERVQ